MSNDTSSREPLFEEFPPVSKEAWEQVIREDLNGADYTEKLRWDTGEGISVLPFYRREDLSAHKPKSALAKSYSNAEPNAWEIRERIYAASIDEAAVQVQQALQRGAKALEFPLTVRRTEGNLGGDLQGLPIQSQKDFDQLISNIDLSETPVHFDSGTGSPLLLAMLRNTTGDQDSEPVASFSYDPFVYLLQHGQYPKKKQRLTDEIVALARFTTDHLSNARPLAIDARLYHNAGGTIVQELSFAMAAASEYLALLTEDGLDAGRASRKLHFSFAVGSNYFLEIAKFRAARLLWKNLLQAYGAGAEADEHPAYLHAETSRWNKSLYDPYTNMLRTSTEGMSAAIAGCDSMTILPFDQHFRRPDEFSRRIAHNQQLILSEETHFDKVSDPGAGSYYIEELTDKLAQEAWELFQDVEQEGGLLKAIEYGTVQSAIQDSRQKRDQAIARRGRIFVGTNQYSNAEDQMNDEIDRPYQTVSLNESDDDLDLDIQQIPGDLAEAMQQGALMGDLVPYLFDFEKTLYRIITPYRGTEAFDELRLATEQHSETPTVLTLPLGNKKWRKARSTFSANFFGCSGYDIKDPIGFDSTDAAIEAVKKQGADIAVICSSDKEYEELVPELCHKLNELENRPIIVLAGYPKEKVEAYRQAGVDEFIYAKCNVLETLTRFQKQLGIIK